MNKRTITFNVYTNGKLSGQLEAMNIDVAKKKASKGFPTEKGCSYPVADGMPRECVTYAKEMSLLTPEQVIEFQQEAADWVKNNKHLLA